jgi:hypothetical protein
LTPLGRPALPAETITSENVALASNGARIIADSVYPPNVAELAIDGKFIAPGDRADANRWHSALGKPHPHWVWIRFRERRRGFRALWGTGRTSPITRTEPLNQANNAQQPPTIPSAFQHP